MSKLNTRDDLIALRKACKNALSLEKRRIFVCGGTGCVAGGSINIYNRLKELMEERGLPVDVDLVEEVHHDERVGLKKSGCHGFCEMGPLIRLMPQGWLYTKVKLEDCEEIVDKTIIGGELIERLAYKQDGVVYARQEDIPFYKRQTRLVLENTGRVNADSIKGYISVDGFTALEKALFEMTPAEIVDEVKESNLRGRGAAASRPATSGHPARARRNIRTTSSATATRATPVLSWTGLSWRVTPTVCSRA